ncbi:hypothetical protein ACH5RR_016339 [Cinchona calisaya]|uniref:Uncharacterized protein n=1 Tax=Cinchona calisaya TaxID=153742 RepID=A0ABD2ZVK8_9GENT
MTMDSVVQNASLEILVGGIESATLGDEAARRRKVQKTALEMKGPPTLTCAVEMLSRTECRVHHKIGETVDAILSGALCFCPKSLNTLRMISLFEVCIYC